MTTSLKTCFKCGADKPRTEFYRHKAMADGLLGKCKECTRQDVRENRASNLDYFQEYDRSRANLPARIAARKAYQQSPEGREALARGRQAYQERNRYKVRAQRLLRQAVRRGDVWRAPCCMAPGCYSTGRLEAHHTHYDNPLCVVWLCSSCHRRLHKEQRERQRGAA